MWKVKVNRRVTLNWMKVICYVLLIITPIASHHLMDVCLAQPAPSPNTIAIPDISVSIGSDTVTKGSSPISASLKLVLLLTALTFAPAMILTMTSFTRIVIVLGMARTSLGTGSAPPNTVITGLALFLTIAIMGPVFEKSYAEGINPYLEGQMAEEQAFYKAVGPFRNFLLANTRDKDIALFFDVTNAVKPEKAEETPLNVLIPAFVISELNSAFQIGFLIALPFLVLDMVVSSVLTSMSMITLPPVVISLPLKLMLFVLVDGWHLLVSSVVRTYTVT